MDCSTRVTGDKLEIPDLMRYDWQDTLLCYLKLVAHGQVVEAMRFVVKKKASDGNREGSIDGAARVLSYDE